MTTRIFFSIFVCLVVVSGNVIQAGTRAVVVESSLMISLAEELETLCSDYENEGADTVIIEVPAAEPFSDWTSHIWVRNQLISIDDLEGAILIGNVPTAFFGSSREMARPSDLPYRLLEATFNDSDSNDVYESVCGNMTSLISIGRVTPLPFSYNGLSSVEQLRTYLNRVHNHRAGNLALPVSRALNFVDSPFGRGNQLPGMTGLLEFYELDEVTNVADADFGAQFDVTTHQSYRSRLEDMNGWEMLCLHSHGDPNQQTFFNSSSNPPGEGTRTGSITGAAYRSWNENVSFYLFSSCSNYNYVNLYTGFPQIASDNIAASALFWGNSTLGVIANSFSAAFENYDDFFSAMNAGAGIGLALNFSQLFHAELLECDEGNISLINGSSIQFQLLGDPWLRCQEIGNETAQAHYTMLYWQTGWLATSIRSILNQIGAPVPNVKKDVFFWTMTDLLMNLTDHWEVRDVHYYNLGTVWFPNWIPLPRIYEVPASYVNQHWGVWLAAPTGIPRGASYSVRPVFSDGNKGGWAGCSVNHPYAIDQYTICD